MFSDIFTNIFMPMAALSPTAVALLELIPLTLAVILYWNRAMKLSWDGRPVPVWRQVSFGFGLSSPPSSSSIRWATWLKSW